LETYRGECTATLVQVGGYAGWDGQAMSKAFKTNEEYYDELIRRVTNLEIGSSNIRNRLDNLEDIQFKTPVNNSKPGWRCIEVLTIDGKHIRQCEVNVYNIDESRGDYQVDDYVVHKNHIVYLSLPTGAPRFKVEWENHGTSA
jgi:hypothetical protein